MSALDQVRDTFFEECDELLEALQEGLLAIQDGEADSETVHSVFRSVHSIKGGAGAFGFEHLVRFAHEFETLLDAVRNDVIEADGEVVTTLLAGSDVLGDLVIGARDETEVEADITDPLIAAFQGFLPEVEGGAEAEAEPEFAPMVLSLDLGGPDGGPDNGFADGLPGIGLPDIGGSGDGAGPRVWVIRFRPHSALYRNGNETVLLLRALEDLGALEVVCDSSALPEFGALDPEESYLSWEIRLTPSEGSVDAVDAVAIGEVFEFVEGCCDLEISAEGGATDTGLIVSPDTSLDMSLADVSPGPVTCDPVEGMDEAMIEARPEAAEEVSETGSLSGAGQSSAPPPGQPPKRPEGPPAKGAKEAAKRAPTVTVRVDVTRIDRLINLVGELVMNQAMLAQGASELKLSAGAELSTGLDEMKQLAREIQDSVMAIRAQPVKSLFQRMSRIVREAAVATGKKVHLEISGEMTEVDKMVIEKLADPLTHMIRNAVDHGLESGEKRAGVGKPEVGTVWLSAAHRSGRIVIEVTDDGGGINRERVRQIAEEKGLVQPEDHLSVEEIDALLFRPGFSTVEKVSNLSGRGVGMDVVNSAIRALSGRIAIRSTPGEGSTFSISLPLTLAVLDGMVVEVAEQKLVIPITAIIEMLRPELGNVHALSHDSDVIFARDTYVPVLDVGYVLGYRDKKRDAGDRVFVLVETDSGGHCAILVDTIHDQRQVVIKGLETNYGKVPGIAAATVLGDGKTALILDPNDDLFVGGAAAAAAAAAAAVDAAVANGASEGAGNTRAPLGSGNTGAPLGATG